MIALDVRHVNYYIPDTATNKLCILQEYFALENSLMKMEELESFWIELLRCNAEKLETDQIYDKRLFVGGFWNKELKESGTNFFKTQRHLVYKTKMQ